LSEGILELLKKHVSIRKYKKEQIPDKILENMIHSAQHAASSNFVQAYSIIKVTDQEKINRLARLSKNEQQILSAPVVLLFCADMKRVEIACERVDVKINVDNLEAFIVTVVDTALLAQNFVIAAESLGYGICYIGGVRNSPAEISELFGLPDKVFPLFGMTVGIPDEIQQVKPRLPVEAVLHENRYDLAKYDSILDEYDQVIRYYYNTRLTNRKDTDWSKSMGEFLKKPRRLHMREFIMSKGFGLQ
jgi:FMN reductase (NADPH)